MSRRFILLLTAMVVVFYFSVIMFILMPMQTNSWNKLRMPQNGRLFWCKSLQWQTPPSKDTVALVSYPGSGNTWLRYLLQQATGVVTGSIYMDWGLRKNGFPAENVANGSVLVVKTHTLPPKDNIYKVAVVLIRNPKHAILAEYNRLHRGHLGSVPKSVFTRKVTNKTKGVRDWSSYVYEEIISWEKLYMEWLLNFQGSMYVVVYEHLVHRTRHVLEGVLNFLHFNYTKEDIDCAMRHREGIYRRKKVNKDFDPYTINMHINMQDARSRLLTIVNEYRKKHNATMVI